MATVMKWGPEAFKRIARGLSRPMKQTKNFFTALALMIDQDAMLMFRKQGARGGRPRWKPFSPETLRTPAGTPKIRYGTDKGGLPPEQLRTLRSRWVKRGGFGRVGKMRKKIRRYSDNSKLLQASGGFRKSFRIMKITKNRMIYGTEHKLAKDIMSVKNRQVLSVNSVDRARYLSQFRIWFKKRLAF